MNFETVAVSLYLSKAAHLDKCLVVEYIWNFSECIVFLHRNDILETRHKQINLIFVYISPERSYIYENDSFYGIEMVCDNLIELSNECPDCLFFSAGDFNTRTNNCLDNIPDDSLDFMFGETSFLADSFSLPGSSTYMKHNGFEKHLVEICCTKCPIHKSGQMKDPNNYRGPYLQSVFLHLK